MDLAHGFATSQSGGVASHCAHCDWSTGTCPARKMPSLGLPVTVFDQIRSSLERAVKNSTAFSLFPPFLKSTAPVSQKTVPPTPPSGAGSLPNISLDGSGHWAALRSGAFWYLK